MVNLIVGLSKYILILLILIYTFSCFSIFGAWDPDDKKKILRRQTVVMFMTLTIAYLIMFLQKEDMKLLIFYGMQVVMFVLVVLLYSNIYPKVSRLVLNNMCMLMSIGFIILTRLSYDKAFKQYIIACGGFVISLIIPVMIRKFKFLAKWKYIYAGIGLAALLAVAVLARTTYGAKLGFSVAGINIQPSELVKIIFVFFVASSFAISIKFKNVVLTTAIAALHVLILVASTDLGSALIIFIVYITMLYVATKQPLYILAGGGAGAAASVLAYKFFTHVHTRVEVWRDPFKNYDKGGYQVAQSLFAIGTGGWFGAGLFNGQPDKIPVAAEDFVFSAICEELGLIFALCIILICLSCYIMILNIAMQLHNSFYKFVALGLGTCYIFQVFLTVGGVTKFIPSTGVTLPFVSYGGSSLVSTLVMFAIIQGLYIVREDEEEDIERQREERLRAKRSRENVKRRVRTSGQAEKRTKKSQGRV
ncbi:MAG: FtsW/RodA/SpoVE family cell cycle protein [Lachnospiraceae bacterium]|nr:FtsW/RodA/SpoVE family cell cycle protein [Lachnospiraceae bacterium]